MAIVRSYSAKQDASHGAGFHAWLKLSRFVREGEKGLVILAPMVDAKNPMRLSQGMRECVSYGNLDFVWKNSPKRTRLKVEPPCASSCVR